MINKAIDALNSAFANDPDAIIALIEHRVPCNEALADHPTVQVGGDPLEVGLLGILNGVLEPLTGSRVAIKYEDEEDGRRRFSGFCEYQAPCQPSPPRR